MSDNEVADLIMAVPIHYSFPTTPIIDNFNRANEDPLSSGGSWSNLTTFDSSNLRVLSNQCTQHGTSATVFYGSAWTVQNFGPDCESYVTVVTVPGGSSTKDVDIYLRSKGSDLVNFPGYALGYNGTNLAFEFIRTDTNGSQTALGADISQTMSNGDSFGLSAIGSTLTGWYKAGAGAWTVLGTRTDATFSAAGVVALDAAGTTAAVFDNFGAGSVDSPEDVVYRGLTAISVP